jgi:hypothetical protein
MTTKENIAAIVNRLRTATDDTRPALVQEFFNACLEAISEDEQGGIKIVNDACDMLKPRNVEDDILNLRAMLNSSSVRNDGAQTVAISRLLRELREKSGKGNG